MARPTCFLIAINLSSFFVQRGPGAELPPRPDHRSGRIVSRSVV
jgi:hypothetical protein